ncbi:trypsin-like serine peptidase [Streptomyces sp. NPDC014733]|uniref:trypsin-like serine peptidase n=1 Tax=Streptomyces sp. NPDC014733 TaxID=3364885 RepID=UPI0036FE0DD3
MRRHGRKHRGKAVAAALGAGLGLTALLTTATVSQAGTAPGPDDRPRTRTAPGAPGDTTGDGHEPRISIVSAAASWTAEAAADFWTPAKMAAAMPHGDAPAGPAATAALTPAAASVPTARHISGIPSVGVLFSVDKDAHAHYCTASVVSSPRRNLLLTAGHCNPGKRAAFVPKYRSGATTQPYGVWAITKSFLYPGHGTTGSASDLDFAFATVAPDRRGRSVESLTGGNTLTPTPGYTNDVTVIGYPSVRNDPEDRAIRCETRTTRLDGYRQLRMRCNGFHGGTSGSPWLTHFDERTRTGRVIGNIGGLNGGGPNGPHADRTSYSPYYGTEILALYLRAISG